MPAVVGVQPGVRDERGQDAPVDVRDDRIVVTGQDQGRLAQQRQQRQRRPACPGGQLVQVAAGWADPGPPVQHAGHLVGVFPRGAAVQLAGDLPGVPRVHIPPGSGQRGQHPRAARHHQHPGTGGDQDDPAAAARLGQRELLGQRAAPGDAEDVGPLVTELVEQPGQQVGQRAEPVRAGRQRGLSIPKFTNGFGFDEVLVYT